MIAGIDYGSKLAGTTVIAFEKEGTLELICSDKKQDADQMILDFVEAYKPSLIGIDAPLSLPGVYTRKEPFDDYFYRSCDKELNAMSPMFLGGLTARAIKLKATIGDRPELIEVYPTMAAKSLNLKRFNYKKKDVEYDKLLNELALYLPNSTDIEITTSHQMDALLALYIVKKHMQGNASTAGLKEEGLIYY